MHTSQAPLSLKGAHLINAVLTIGYVLPLYFTKYTRLSFSKTQANNRSRSKNPSERWRDDPTVIKARLSSVSASMIASLFLMHYIVVSQGNATHVSKLSLGFLSFIRSSQGVWDTVTRYLGFSFRIRDLPAHFVTPMLFLGPLYGRYLARDLPFMRPWTFNGPNKNTFDWIGFRNYVVVSGSTWIPTSL
jgi:prenyl protein peptidase